MLFGSTLVLLVSLPGYRAFSSLQEVFHTTNKWCVGTSIAPTDKHGRIFTHIHLLYISCRIWQHSFHDEMCVGGTWWLSDKGQNYTGWELGNLTCMASLIFSLCTTQATGNHYLQGNVATRKFTKMVQRLHLKKRRILIYIVILTYVRRYFRDLSRSNNCFPFLVLPS